jgi:hypothetical protein
MNEVANMNFKLSGLHAISWYFMHNPKFWRRIYSIRKTEGFRYTIALHSTKHPLIKFLSCPKIS